MSASHISRGSSYSSTDTVTVGIVDIDAVGHAMIDAHVEFDAERLQMFQLLQPGVAVRHGERDVVGRLGAE